MTGPTVPASKNSRCRIWRRREPPRSWLMVIRCRVWRLGLVQIMASDTYAHPSADKSVSTPLR